MSVEARLIITYISLLVVDQKFKEAVRAIGGSICPISRLCDTISKDTVSHMLYFNLSHFSMDEIKK